jgi:hypothetical protein
MTVKPAGSAVVCTQHPGFFELDLDFTVLLGERERHVAEITCVDACFQVDLDLAG